MAWGYPTNRSYLTGEYADQFVRGMQNAPEDPYHIQASACCKHFAGMFPLAAVFLCLLFGWWKN